MSNKPNTTFLVKKKDLFKARFLNQAIAPLQPGEVLLRINKYAFTSNNITYGVFGDRLYWSFFPGTTSEGIIPVWGFAEVVVSNNEAIEKGERFYGYYPMSDLLIVKPGKLNKFGFADMMPHRVALPPIYNVYNRTSTDPAYVEALEDYIPIIKPLFATAFLNYQLLKDEAFFKAKKVVLTSASSKTALGLAFMLKENQKKDGLKIIGLTSAHNSDFVKSTGLYDEVIAYEDYPKKIKKVGTIVVDFSGNTKLLQGIADHLGKFLKFMSLIGFTDWEAAGVFKHPNAKMFFAPDHAQVVAKAWGAVKLNQRIGKSLFKFIELAQAWIEIEPIKGKADIKKLYLAMLGGKIDPSKGNIVQS